MAGIKIDFVADVSKFIGGTRDIEGALDQVGDSLDDVAREAQDSGERAGDGLRDGVSDGARDAERSLEDVGDASRSLDEVGDRARDAGDELGDGLKDGGRDAERALDDVEDTAKKSLDGVGDHADDAAKETETATEKMERSFKDAFDKATGESKKAGDDVSQNTRRGMREAGDSTETFKNEARQNLSESVSSFRGDVEDIPQLVQDVFGGVAADLGPAGLIGGTLVAAGIGIGVAYLQGTTEKAAEVKQQIIDLAGEIRDVGGDLSQLDMAQITWDWATEIGNAKQFFQIWKDGDLTNLELASTAAEELGVSVSDMFAAMLEPESAQAKQLLEDINQRILDLQGAHALDEEVDALRRMKEALEEGELSTAEAEEINLQYQAAIEGTTVEALEAAEAEAALREQRDASRDATRSLMEAEIDFAAQLDETSATIEENGRTIDLNTEAGRENRKAILDQADSSRELVQAFLDQGGSADEATRMLSEHRRQLIDNATQAGYSQEAAEDLADELLGIPGQVRTEFEVDTEDAQRKINRFITDNDGRTIRIYTDSQGNTTGWTGARNERFMNSGGYVAPGFADGGHVGSDIDDRINARLSPGEYVMDAQATEQIGVGILDALNNGQTPGGAPPVQQAPERPSIVIENITAADPYAAARAFMREVQYQFMGSR